MNESGNGKPLIVGIFIFLGLAILVAGIFTVGGQRKAFIKTFPVHVIFDDVEGLQPGNNVWLSGMKIGTVRKVDFSQNARVEVILSIENKARSHIHKDANARISTDGLVGNKIVVIYGGTDSSATIAAGDFLQNRHVAGIQEIASTLQANNANLLEITGNLRQASRQLATGRGTLGQLIADSDLVTGLRASIQSLRRATGTSARMISNLEDFSSGLHKPGTLGAEIITDTSLFHNLKNAVSRLNEATATASDFARSLQQAGAGLNDPNAPLGMLLHDTDVTADLQRTIKNLRISSGELAEDLEAVQHNWLLRGFFKKKNKD